MSETPSEQPNETPGDQQQQPEPAGSEKSSEPKTFTQDELNSILARERRKFGDYDDLQAKAQRLDEIEEQSKSEQEKATEAAKKAAQERDEARAETLRYKAAATHKVDMDYFDLLGSGSEEEINTRAERVGSLLSVSAENEQLKAELAALKEGKSAPGASRPTRNLRPGASPAEQTPADDAYPAGWIPQRG